MKAVRSYIFVDEVKDVPATVHDAGQWIFLMGIGIPGNTINAVETRLSTVLQPLGSNGFHAKDSYKEKSPNFELMNAMSDIVASFRLPWFCFPFAKTWLTNPRLEILQKMQFNGWQPKVSNYEFAAFYFFLHCLNTFLLANSQLQQSSRLICDQGIRNSREGFSFEESEILKTIENVIFASRKQASLLALPDHIGYLFGKCRRELSRNNGEINLEPQDSNTPVQNECLKHINALINRGLFHRLDLCEWIDYENKRLERLNSKVDNNINEQNHDAHVN